ncbi:serine/threonine-protein phosphatase 2A activator, partial [Fopius arisanus]|uniref:Serine/threonine-protein phosphatase 2A activator n=2 Tax=Fopius arisanus TaxID=64838 RepID=A0A9R1TRB7_9HYME
MSVPGAHLVEHGVVGKDHVFETPTKAVKTMEDMVTWEKSEAYNEYLGFILALNEAVQGKAANSKYPASQTLLNTVAMLNIFDQWLTEIPPTDQPQRFGNKSFRDWHGRLLERSEDELKKVLPKDLHRAIPELSPYLCEGFGNATRIDYGTGHEMAFIMFLCCLFKIGAYQSDDKVAAVNKVFSRYMEFIRRLQLVYRMEPAGSHGVWSLDDYQFVPFVWGSAQL